MTVSIKDAVRNLYNDDRREEWMEYCSMPVYMNHRFCWLLALINRCQCKFRCSCLTVRFHTARLLTSILVIISLQVKEPQLIECDKVRSKHFNIGDFDDWKSCTARYARAMKRCSQLTLNWNEERAGSDVKILKSTFSLYANLLFF